MLLYFFFFFQAEDGIRDLTVTGVQTCALPISRLDRITKWMHDWVDSGRLAGMTVAILRKGELAYAHTHGKADVERNKQIGRASCRGRGEISVVAVSLKKKKKKKRGQKKIIQKK